MNVTGAARKGRESGWPDARLIEECLKGNESAWSALIDRYQNLVFSIPIKYGFSQDDAADIFQAVCMDLLADLERIREPNALAGWLLQVTRNKCFHRKKEQRRQTGEEIDELQLPAAEDGSDAILSQVQEEQLLRRVIRELSPRCQRLVKLLFFEAPARPYQEIARDLGLAIGSIGLIRRRCLNQLRKGLAEAGFSAA